MCSPAFRRAVGPGERAALVAVTHPAQTGVGLQHREQLRGEAVGVIDRQPLVGELGERFDDRRGTQNEPARVRRGAAAHFAEDRGGERLRAGLRTPVREPEHHGAGEQHQSAHAQHELRAETQAVCCWRGGRRRRGCC